MKRISLPKAILLGGTIGGVLDILFAISFAAYNSVGPVRLLQTVATGVMGEAAFSGGIGAAALGLACHFGLSFIWAALFLAVARHVPRITSHQVLSGILFGVLVFFVMRLVVLPLSAFPYPVSFKPLAAGLDLLSHMFLFGVPIAAAASRALAPTRP